MPTTVTVRPARAVPDPYVVPRYRELVSDTRERALDDSEELEAQFPSISAVSTRSTPAPATIELPFTVVRRPKYGAEGFERTDFVSHYIVYRGWFAIESAGPLSISRLVASRPEIGRRG